MSQAELNEFLLTDGIGVELDLLGRLLAVRDLRNLTVADDLAASAETIDWSRCLLAGSILAKGDDRPSQEAALRIATAAVTLSEDPAVSDAGALLLEKLGNGRAVRLGEDKRDIEPGLQARLGISARLQSTYRALENSVLVDTTGEMMPVNRFQLKFWKWAQGSAQWISASAPTASGKTYIVLRWLLDRLASSDADAAIYLAPTRALVSEIAENLARMCAEQGLETVEVSTLPLVSQYKAARERKGKLVFVLTQERLHLLANAAGEDLGVDLLVVDEAHKIGDRLRGVILQDAVERVTRTNEHAQVVFVSPSTENPGSLLEDAPASASTQEVDSDTPTVLQNVILASQVQRKPDRYSLELQQGEKTVPLGTLKLPARPTTLRKRLAFVAAAVAPESGTLVYANGPAEAEEIALLISQLLPRPASQNKDPDLAALAQLARKGVHSAYQLAPLVEAQVAFHYGNMPSLIRSEIERLFRIGKIKFLVCTSTLIEGVNLACRTIVVRGPRKGLGKPMQPHDFWNLAGRAGRWGDEFQGNIVCIDPGREDAWPTGVPKRARYPIERETDQILGQPDDLASFLEARWNAPMEEVGRVANAPFEQVSAYLISTHKREGTIMSAPFTKRHPASELANLNRLLAGIAEKITLPTDIVTRHPGVSGVGLEQLHKHFASHHEQIEGFLPAPPESDDAYKRLVRVMELINAHVYPAFYPSGLVPLHALVTNEWLRGLSLAAIIKARIRYHQRHGHQIELPKLFRETMALVETTARFLAPKYVAAYMDVLRHHLMAAGRPDLAADDLDYGLMLEFGLSTKTLMTLMEMGLSRMSAVELYEKIAMDDLDHTGVRDWLAEFGPRLESLEVPTLIIREVRAVLGRDIPMEPLADEPGAPVEEG